MKRRKLPGSKLVAVKARIVISLLLALGGAGLAQSPEPTSGTPALPSVSSLLQVRRIYVGELTGGFQADALRELLISSLDSTKLFVLTDNVERADAVLKGAGNDSSFTDSFDKEGGVSARENGGKGNSSLRSSGSLYGALSASDNESYHVKEHKHEAYAAVRLCNRDGDVLWSTTQEGMGAKFRGASADVAAKVARQLTLDFDRARRAGTLHP